MNAVLISLGAILATASTGVVNAQPAEMPTSANYVSGETWEWRRSDALTKLEEARTLVTVVKADGGMHFSLEGKTVPVEVRQVQGGYQPSSRPWRVWPLAVGKRWDFEAGWTRADGATGSSEQKVEVVAYEEVTVPAGKFMAYRIEHRGYFKNSNGNSGRQDDTYWYSPEVRMDVKQERRSGRPVWVSELISHKKPAP